jgi:non-specific serine/threonine protein kinase
MTTAPRAGQTISHYRLIEPLGSGAMGEVWLAEDTQLPRQVAIKLLPQHRAEDANAVSRLVREARATASIDHPAVATVYEAGEIHGRPYLVMQYFEGETLAERIERGAMPVAAVLSLASTVADALAEVHAVGIVHRDLKPSNIMLTPRGPRILDFGVASVSASPRLTTPGTLIGTPVTMSPEQVAGRPPDNRSDLWALGVILYQALTGRLPFEGTSYESVFNNILHHQPDHPSFVRPEVDSELDHVVMKLLRKEATHRYPRAEDLLADLSSCQRTIAISTNQPTLTIRGRPAHVPRIAVLPFEVLSPDADDAYLAGGLVEDLIVDLTRLDGVHIASRAEVAGYTDRNVPPRTLARELGVEFVLLGSVRRAGNRARISAQLVRSSDGHVLWAERFDRTLEDLFGVQEEVSRQIVDALQVALKPGEREMLRRAPTKNTEAYTHYLKARELLEQSRDENFRAERLLKQALEIDPEFALAHAALGECYAKRGLRWWGGLEVADQALACAQRALELEPGLPDAFYVELMVMRLKGQPEQILQAIEKVLATNPDHGEAREWAAWSYLTLGKPDEALPILESLTERYSALSFLCNCYEMVGREEDSRRGYRMLRERLIEDLRRNPEAVHERSILGTVLARQGSSEAAIAQAERAIALAPGDGRIRYNAACTYAQCGMPERAIEQLKEGVKNLPDYIAAWPQRDPDLASIHDDPEFIRLFGSAQRN